MKKLNSIEKSIYINKRYKDYLRSSFCFGSNELQSLFESQLDQEELLKGPYVDVNLPFSRGLNLHQLIQEGVVCTSFSKLCNVNMDRPLYAHQEKAIRLIDSGRSAIITTGTGSGKTECFLYPIFNDLLKDVENGVTESGIRAIFLYPMNALVNDQIERVRNMLVSCPDITFGFFTGDTPETVSDNYRAKYKEENDIIIPNNELVSRKEIRDNPPHLLFTNYSMLEYMLIRPNDYALFSPTKLTNWKYVVLDEAHTYKGSLGIEISMLMRRLTALADKKPRFILTSATLGQQGESEEDIVSFGKKLTSVDFAVSDIVFSDRISLDNSKVKYMIEPDDYVKMKAGINDVLLLKNISEKYGSETSDNIQTSLYNILVGDGTVHQVCDILSNNPLSYRDLMKQLSKPLNEKELTALIDLINAAEKDGIGLLDMKYHSFIRPLSGAYITLDKSPKLSLSKTNEISNQKAFELGNCRYCNEPYIFGKILYSESTGLNYLVQNNEVDIYENYGDNSDVNLDYFLLNNSVTDSEVDTSSIEKYTVCRLCGCIYSNGNLNSAKCTCGDEYATTIYKVNQIKEIDNEYAFNNINHCPCCGHRSGSGIVRSLNLGKDEGTALVAQMLYEAIDNGEEQEKKTRKLSLSLNKSSIQQNNRIKPRAKQFLSFSDSRQQASFSAAFFDSSQTRLLQKRLIWKVIEDYNYSDIQIEQLISYLADVIKKMDLFSNGLSPQKNAWLAVLTDLLKVDGSYDGEGMGLYYFDLDLSTIDELLDEEDVTASYGQYNITKSDLLTIMKVVFDIFKTTPAINYAKSGLLQEERKEYLDYRRFDNYIAFKNPKKTSKDIRSFLPINSSENMVVRYVEKAVGCSKEEATQILDVFFNNFAIPVSQNANSADNLLIKDPNREAFQINSGKYVLKNYKSSKYYICSKCGRLTPYNVHNVCVVDKCNGSLSEVNPDEALANNYFRRQYMTKKIEKIVIKEHTAQLDRKTAKQYQQDFKNQKINILSCSTTFEMGVDIGELETVYMRNVPPSPANYVQRAGRAGRRKDSSAYILTYCNPVSHDYTYFTSPEKMISGVITPPCFDVMNKKIITRHLMSACLGYFFRLYPFYFENIERLVFDDGVEKFYDYCKSHPNDLNEYISEKVLPESQYNEFKDFLWFDSMDNQDEKMAYMVESLKSALKEYTSAYDESVKKEDHIQASYFQKQIEGLKKERVLDQLSKYCVIPKYGFPVDSVNLEIYNNGKIDRRFDLSRDLRIAISEYAPDSEVIVDGKKYTSQFISLPRSKSLDRRAICKCPNCSRYNVFVVSHDKCKYCGENIASQPTEYYVEPILGFKTGVTKESTRLKPQRSYLGEVLYLGKGNIEENSITLDNVLYAESSTNDELLVINKSKFIMCPKCGYSKRIKGNTALNSHNNYRQFKCECEEREYYRIGHSFQTDAVRIEIPRLLQSEKHCYSKALSLLYAFLEGLSISLDIERSDIDGLLVPNPKYNSYDILIYDNVPGGAGHVRRIMNKQTIIGAFETSLKIVSHQCCDENTSCYNCLRNYYNQSVHSKLKRKYAIELLESLLADIK
ncbi:MAG: DEAD/DEAH box helicase [Oscillospiraceae bacterium]